MVEKAKIPLIREWHGWDRDFVSTPGYYLLLEKGFAGPYESPEQIRILHGPHYGFPAGAARRKIVLVSP